ncbi:LysR family transcriptional regulator [uncultured Bradyrhizobium sp.]|uniref:LysR family transcriptional regulator n=1 Tax=uncultured Bradyrhizobium sp. TaxID=199684 RepID=UPI002633B22A|nr:LysR family transcriptional regulator [uncultured Bradyrhizobium sp.]
MYLRRYQVYEAVFRLKSFSRAAEELNITASAVSHQIRIVSEEVGRTLFVRDVDGIQFTETGALLGNRLMESFTDIKHSINDASRERLDQLRITCCTSISASIMPSIVKELLESGLDVDVATNTTIDDVVSPINCDVFITTGNSYRLFEYEELMSEIVAPVTSSKSTDGNTFITTKGVEALLPLLGFEQPSDVRQVRCSLYVAALAMCLQGVGVAILPLFLVRPHLESGELILWKEAFLPSGRNYSMAVNKSTNFDSRISKVRKIIRRNFAQVAGSTLEHRSAAGSNDRRQL